MTHEQNGTVKVSTWKKNTVIQLDPKIPRLPLPALVFIPTIQNEPPPAKPLLKLNGTQILTQGNLSAIIADPGAGKSSMIEAIGASFLNPKSDTLGFTVDPECKGILIVDTERVERDVWNSWDRMRKRANFKGEPENVKFIGMRSQYDLKDRLHEIEQQVQLYPCSLLIIDGASDLVIDTNDLTQTNQCRGWLRRMTNEYDLSIFVSLHPNPGAVQPKPRGHLGSELCREAECVMLAKKSGNIHQLTTDFAFGKNRNGGKAETAFTWSDPLSMFISTDLSNIKGKESYGDKLKKLAQLMTVPLSHKDFCNLIIKADDCSQVTAKRKIKDMVEAELVTKNDSLYYYNEK